jgi:methylthioribose-1-phosphate isomerase
VKRLTPIDFGNLPIEWLGDRVRLIDQTRLPREEIYLDLDDYRGVILAIKEMRIRGAPAIGIAGAYAVALGALKIKAPKRDAFLEELNHIIEAVAATRPTARNLFFALERMRRAADAGQDVPGIKQALVSEAMEIHADEAEATHHLSLLGAGLLEDGWTVLTHCNTGPLATSGQGTALGIIIAAHRQGKNIKVLVDETRPLLQGARLTAWELKRAGIPGTLITDSMAGYFIKLGKVDGVITGADRIAANGDTANKVGTYTLAVLAGENDIPFYIAAPTSTIDMSLASGDDILIEERDTEEVTRFQGVPVAPEGFGAANPAFDVTPHRYISAIITEKAIIREPYGEGLRGITRA